MVQIKANTLDRYQPRSQGFSLEGGRGGRAPPTFKGKALGTRLDRYLIVISTL